MDHTAQTPADDRAARLLEHADIPEPRKSRALATLRAAQQAAHAGGAELQAEFGKEHVGLIVACNQFLRIWRSGPEPGAVEILLPKDDRAALGSSYSLRAPDGAVFKLFGWVRLDPEAGEQQALDDAVRNAFRHAAQAGKKA